MATSTRIYAYIQRLREKRIRNKYASLNGEAKQLKEEMCVPCVCPACKSNFMIISSSMELRCANVDCEARYMVQSFVTA